MATLNENVFIGSDNEINLIVSDNDTGLPVDFVSNGTTKIEAEIGGIVISSETGEITYGDGGVIDMTIGMVAGLTVGNYNICVKVFDPEHTQGQVFIHSNMKRSSVMVRISGA